MDEIRFIVNLYSFPLPLVPQPNRSFPKVRHLHPSQTEQLPNIPTPPSFSVNLPFFWGYLNSQVRTNKMVNCLVYHPCPSRLAPRIHPFIFLWTPLSLSRMLVAFFVKLLYSTTCGKIFKFMELTFLENALIQGIFTHVPLHSKLAPKFLSSRPRQKEITPCPRQHSFENLFLPIAERDGGNYDLLYQNWVRKYEDYFEH